MKIYLEDTLGLGSPTSFTVSSLSSYSGATVPLDSREHVFKINN
jgi:hypothetical protein